MGALMSLQVKQENNGWNGFSRHEKIAHVAAGIVFGVITPDSELTEEQWYYVRKVAANSDFIKLYAAAKDRSESYRTKRFMN
jgi:hypothetical protein